MGSHELGSHEKGLSRTVRGAIARPLWEERPLASLRTGCRRPCRCCVRPPAATARRGGRASTGRNTEIAAAALSSPPKLPPPPPRCHPSMVRVELKPCSTTSVEYFSTPLLVGPFPGLASCPRCTLAPLLQILLGDLQSPSLKITTRCHSVFSLRSPVPCRARFSEVATLRLAIGRPSGSAGSPDPCRDFRPKSPCSRFPPSHSSRSKSLAAQSPAQTRVGARPCPGRPYTLAGPEPAL